MALIDSVIVFVISLLVGATGIYVGARILTNVDDFTYAIFTALLASLAWVVASFFLGWIPFLGPLVALVAYLAVVNVQYPGGWLKAGGIALVAWVTSLVILYIFAALNLVTPDAIGVVGA